MDPQEKSYLSHLALELYLFEVSGLAETPVQWTIDPTEDSETATERIWHFQAQGHARLGVWMTKLYSGVPSKSFRIPPDPALEALWETLIRQIASFSRSILTPLADYETGINATLVAAMSSRRLRDYIDIKEDALDDVRRKIFLNTYTHLYSMMLMYRNHTTFSDKVASQKLEKIATQTKKAMEAYLHKTAIYEIIDQSMFLAKTGVGQLEEVSKK